MHSTVAGRTWLRSAVALSLAAALAACGSTTPAPGNATDAAFVLHMLPHHVRAIAVGELAESRGGDPRVRAFGHRIVTEQTPEEERLESWVSTLGLHPQPADAGMADGYITDAELARLRSEPVAVFDRDVLALSATSEEGAVAMSAPELSSGRYAPARQLASSISGAPDGEIPQLRALAHSLPG